MPDKQKLERFWTKLIKSCTELQYDFGELDLQDKQVVQERVTSVLKMQGITVGVDSLIGVIGNLRR